MPCLANPHQSVRTTKADLLVSRKIHINLLAGPDNGHGLRVLVRKGAVAQQFKILGIDNVQFVSLGTRLMAAAFHLIVVIDRVEYRATGAPGKFDLVDDLIILAIQEFNHPDIIASVAFSRFSSLNFAVAFLSAVVSGPGYVGSPSCASMLRLASINHHAIPLTTVTTAAKSRAGVQPNLFAISAVKTGDAETAEGGHRT